MKVNNQSEKYYNDVSIEDLVKIYETTDKSWKQIADDNGIPLWLMLADKDRYYRQAKRLEPKKHPVNYKEIPKSIIEKIIEEYINTDLSWEKLAKKHEVPLRNLYSKINLYMAENGITEIKKVKSKNENVNTVKISAKEICDTYKENKSVNKTAGRLGLPNKIVRLVLRQMLLEDEKILTTDLVQILLEQGFELEDIKQEANKRGIEVKEKYNKEPDSDEGFNR